MKDASKVPKSKTPKKPTPKVTIIFNVETRYVGEAINLKELQQGKVKLEFVNRGDHPLVIRLSEHDPGEYAILTKHGTVTFWNVSTKRPAYLAAVEEGKIKLLGLIAPFIQSKKENYELTDTLEVTFGARKGIKKGKQRLVTLDKVLERTSFFQDGKPNVEFMKIISLVSAKFVTMDRYVPELDERRAAIRPFIKNLAGFGELPEKEEKELKKQSGAILEVEDDLIGVVGFLDKPDEIWDIPGLEDLYDELSAEYLLGLTLSRINGTINYLMRANDILSRTIAAEKSDKAAEKSDRALKQSARSEKAIVWLILIEIAIGVVPYLSGIYHYIRHIFHV
jgi:uncharacterized Rmd1/YagE family protein